jgi:hypothetical protein
LTVENGRTWFGFPPKRNTQFSPQRSIDLFPNSLLLPSAEIPIGREPAGQIMRDHTPRTAAAQHIQNGIHDLSPLNFLRTSFWLFSWNQRFQDLPFFIRYI